MSYCMEKSLFGRDLTGIMLSTGGMNEETSFLTWILASPQHQQVQVYQYLQALAHAQSVTAANSYVGATSEVHLPGNSERAHSVPNVPASLAIPQAIVQQPMHGLMQMDLIMSMHERVEAAEHCADVPAPSLPAPSGGPAAMSADRAVSTFSEAIRSLLNNKLLPSQHSNFLISLRDSIAAGSSGQDMESFAGYLVCKLAALRPSSFKSSHVWGPSVSAFQDFTTGEELTTQWRAALTACSIEMPSDPVVRETLQYLITDCNSIITSQASTQRAESSEGPPIEPIEIQKVCAAAEVMKCNVHCRFVKELACKQSCIQ